MSVKRPIGLQPVDLRGGEAEPAREHGSIVLAEPWRRALPRPRHSAEMYRLLHRWDCPETRMVDGRQELARGHVLTLEHLSGFLNGRGGHARGLQPPHRLE